MKVTVEKLIDGLRHIPDEQFTCDNVYQFLGDTPVDNDSLARFMFWSPSFYTRNLIYKDHRFEMMTICWEVGQISRIHDHAEQKCWMTVAAGRLQGQNYAVEAIDESRGFCKLTETDQFDLAECVAAKVELDEPIHQIRNLPEFGERAVSLHIYSRPFGQCRSFCADTDTFKTVDLAYTSIDGKLCDGIRL